MNNNPKIKILFVCMGNICRSPLAEGVFRQHLQRNALSNRFEVDSAGTANYHVGAKPDARAIKIAAKHGVNLNHRARQFEIKDFKIFDYILVMDHLNYDAVVTQSQNQEHQDKVFLFRSFDSSCAEFYDVPDPYYGSEEDFVEVNEIANRASVGFIDFLRLEGRLN